MGDARSRHPPGAAAPAGDGGDIRIRTGLLEASERSFITSESWGPGNGGLIDVEADEIRLLSGASISGVATFSPWATGYGDGGSLRIQNRETGGTVVTCWLPSANR